MKLVFIIALFFIIFPFHIHGDTGDSIILYFKTTGTPLSYLVTAHMETTDVLNTSQASGADQTLKNTSYEYSEEQKEITRTTSAGEPETGDEDSIQGTMLEGRAKIYFIKKVGKMGAAKSIRPVEKIVNHSAIGRMIDPFDMEDLPLLGLPLLFSRAPVKEGDTWEKKFDFSARELPVLSMSQLVTLKRVLQISTQKVAELDYTFKGGLFSTQMTDDPDTVAKINEMKQNNIESVSFEGSGSAAFDIERGTLVTHNLTMTRRIRKTTIHGDERVIEDVLTTYEFAEALTN